MFFIGETSCRGTYFFHSLQLNGWVVSDLDEGTAKVFDKLAVVKVKNLPFAYDEVVEKLERRSAVLGQEGERFLIDGERTLIPLVRDKAEFVEILMVYYPDGTYAPYGKLEKEMASIARKAKKNLKGCE